MKQHTSSGAPLGVISNKGVHGVLLSVPSSLSAKLFFYWQESTAQFNLKSKEVSLRFVDGSKEKINLCSQFHFSETHKGWIATYIRTEKTKKTLVIADAQEIHTWIIRGSYELTHSQGDSALISETNQGEPSMYLGGLFTTRVTSTDYKTWTTHPELLFTSRPHLFDSIPLSLMGGMSTPYGNFVIYDASYKKEGLNVIQAGGVLFDPNDPKKMIWRSEVPLWKSIIYSEQENLKPIGVVFAHKTMTLYWASAEGSVVSTAIEIPFTSFSSVHTPKEKLYLQKHSKNPILKPQEHNHWENEAVFNPAAIYDEGRVHLLYRAIGRNNLSMLGYASSADGLHFDERHSDPAYFPRADFEGSLVKGPSEFTDLFASGGGWGGCEDPKLTSIDNKIYLTYVAFNGWSHPRLALSSIDREDFLAKRWKWTNPQLISKPGIVDKSGAILSEKIDGKYVIFHRVFPDILIDFVDSLDFKKDQYLEGKYKIEPRLGMWDSRKLSVGAPPIKTKDGWFVIYHAVDDRDPGKYKIGAMILDLYNPTKVLHRTEHPILIPDMHYENHGKPGVAYPCGAVVIDDTLFVYYGGGDTVVCVATAPLRDLIEKVKQDAPDIVFNPTNSLAV